MEVSDKSNVTCWNGYWNFNLCNFSHIPLVTNGEYTDQGRGGGKKERKNEMNTKKERGLTKINSQTIETITLLTFCIRVLRLQWWWCFKLRSSGLWRCIVLWYSINVSKAQASKWRCRQHETVKFWYPTTALHGIRTHKTLTWNILHSHSFICPLYYTIPFTAYKKENMNTIWKPLQ